MNKVEHPEYYNKFNIECIDVAELFNFNKGNAIKYIWRAGLKSDNAIEDLQKAIFYLNREIERIKQGVKDV